jgi:uncharacterized membrane protein
MGRLLASLRRTFLQGILLILPLAITYAILRWLFILVTGFSAPWAEELLRRMGAPAEAMAWMRPIIAAVLTVAVVMIVGLVGGNFAGRRLWRALESFVMRIPMVKWFYGSTRQLLDAFQYAGGSAFREVVLVEYPRHGLWSLGFVTVPAVGMIPGRPDEDGVYVFVPTTPNPTSGYTIVVPRGDAHRAGITVEEGLKVILSGGFIAPVRATDDRAATREPA